VTPVDGVEEKDKVACGHEGAGCGKTIVWGSYWEDGDGKRPGGLRRVPLDPSAPCYRVVGRDKEGRLKVERDRRVMPSHFKTCPKAALFSRSKAGEPAPADPVPQLFDRVEVVDGPFSGLRGILSREGKIGAAVHGEHRHYLGWWLTIEDEEGKHVGLCMIGPAQVRIIEAWTQDGKINYGTIDPTKAGPR
jgi:hypothetical protein